MMPMTLRRLLLGSAALAMVWAGAGANASGTPFPRFVSGKARVVTDDGVALSVKLDGKDNGVTDEGEAMIFEAGAEPVAIDLNCVNVLSARSALVAGTTSDGLTSYLFVVEDRGVGKDSLAVSENAAAKTVCDAGLVPPLPAPKRISRGDLLIRTT